MADRIGVISAGRIVLVEDKQVLMHKLGKKQLTLHLQQPLSCVPAELARYGLELADQGHALVFTFDAQHGIDFKDLQSSQSSLEEIFVSLLEESRA